MGQLNKVSDSLHLIRDNKSEHLLLRNEVIRKLKFDLLLIFFLLYRIRE